MLFALEFQEFYRLSRSCHCPHRLSKFHLGSFFHTIQDCTVRPVNPENFLTHPRGSLSSVSGIDRAACRDTYGRATACYPSQGGASSLPACECQRYDRPPTQACRRNGSAFLLTTAFRSEASTALSYRIAYTSGRAGRYTPCQALPYAFGAPPALSSYSPDNRSCRMGSALCTSDNS